MREFVGKLADRYAPSTVRTYFTPLAQILDFAELQPNPARHTSVKLPGRRQEEPTPNTLAEFRALLGGMPRKYVLPMRVLEAPRFASASSSSCNGATSTFAPPGCASAVPGRREGRAGSGSPRCRRR